MNPRFSLLLMLLAGAVACGGPPPAPSPITFTVKNDSDATRLFRLSDLDEGSAVVFGPAEITKRASLTSEPVAARDGEQRRFRFEVIAAYGPTLAEAEVTVNAKAPGTHCSITYIEWIPGNQGEPRVDVECTSDASRP